MFLLSSIQTVILGIFSLIAPLVFSGLETNNDSGCSFETLEENTYFSNYVITSGSYQRIEREDHHLLHEMGWPVNNPVVSSGWGARIPSCTNCSSYHQGVDFVPGKGEPVMAAMRGHVVAVEKTGGYGVHVIIEHDLHTQVWHTLYAHLKRDSVPKNILPGTYVEIGDVIGKVGNTGTSTGPHLHFEIRIDGVKVNPLPILNKNIPSS